MQIGVKSVNLSCERNAKTDHQQVYSPSFGKETLNKLVNQISDMDKKTSSSSDRNEAEKDVEQKSQIKDVWKDNFFEELAIISSLIET